MHKTKLQLSSQSGFSLLEIMVVVAIIGFMVVTVGLQMMGSMDDAKQTRAKADISSISSALGIYYTKHGNYPSTDQGLDALIKQPSGVKNWSQLLSKMPTDPWGREYLYLSPGQHGDYDLYSLGRDGREGGEGADADINNWEN